ncbi:MAG: hypothetical protein A2Y12_18835 [Planctomycetes bacterium GWF2_42_9]|nr:MAG: hypothetical protein A2Y12_18835 [Planctomycetes bacterium GWF2_42_9]
MNFKIKEHKQFPINWENFYIEIPVLACNWISYPNANLKEPSVLQYHLNFKTANTDAFTLHISADQNYMLWLDGEYIGRGSEMKSPENWFFESYEISVDKGKHSLEAIVWHYGDLSPDNRMSVFPGFIVIPDAKHIDLLGTGIAKWKVKKLHGITFHPLLKTLGVYISVPPVEIRDYRKFSHVNKSAWLEPQVLDKGINGTLRKEPTIHSLVPSLIKELYCSEIMPGKAVHVSETEDKAGYINNDINNLNELNRINSNLNKKSLFFKPNTTTRVILSLDNYYCGYTKLSVKNGSGAKIKITWAEAGFTDPQKSTKSHRDVIAGKYFRGVWDEFILDGAKRELLPLAWRSGRYIELYIKTSYEPLEIKEIKIIETRYDLKPTGKFQCDQKTLNEIVPLCIRTLQVSSHDNFVDCPFYEQLPYTGDGRLEALANLAFFKDDSLVRKMLIIFSESRDLQGFTMSSWPRKVWNVIPSFSLSWIGMLHDYALWRNDKKLIASLIPAMRALLDCLLTRIDSNGFLRGVDTAWNFIDWVDEWAKGECAHNAPSIQKGVNATYNWLFVYILGLAKEIEEYAGDAIMASRWEKLSAELAEKLQKRFWVSDKGLFKDDDSGKCFSEHTQILAILSERLPMKNLSKLRTSLFMANGLAKCSIYYKHYFFEACRKLDIPEKIIDGLQLWHSFIDNGFKTVPETFENKTFNQRSDCHGWGSHPLYHLIANVCGIRPFGMGFHKVIISPMLASLSKVEAKCVHPDGMIDFRYVKSNGKIHFEIILPRRLYGEFRFQNNIKKLKPGKQSITIKDQ